MIKIQEQLGDETFFTIITGDDCKINCTYLSVNRGSPDSQQVGDAIYLEMDELKELHRILKGIFPPPLQPSGPRELPTDFNNEESLRIVRRCMAKQALEEVEDE